ncbi:MAG: T9SS type A sorting domain-containing protein [Bacteroidales bacterium]|nr:T9SS type A sorting domain-containing protein [Bacteroidales bacterium]
MKKSLLLLAALAISLTSGWAQPVPGNPVTTIATVTINQNTSTVDIPVTVAEFSEVGIISLVLTYPGAEIYSPSVIYINPALVAWDNFAANTSIADTITIAAMDPDMESPYYGITLDDGDTLFILRFTVGSVTDFADILFYENSEGTSCEIGGVAPNYPEFLDTPMEDYYIAGGVEMIDLDAGTIGSAQFICSGDDPAAFTSTSDASGEGSITYQWQMSTTGESEGFANIEGATASTYDAGSLTVDTWYRRQATATLNGISWSEFSNVVMVNVIIFDPESIAAPQTICEGSDPNEFAGNYAFGDGTFTYQWQASTTGPTEGFSDIEGATDHYYDAGSLTADTWFRRETTASLGGTQCTGYSNVILVTVLNFDPGTVAGGGETICAGADPAAFTSSTDASGDGTISYQWQMSTTGESTGFSNIQGATASAFDPGPTSVNTWFRRMASSSANGITCYEYSNTLSITVNTIEAGTIGSTQYIAEGADPVALTSETAATAAGAFSYQWQVSTTSDTEGFSNIEGATAATYDPGILTADAWYRRMASSLLNSVSCEAYSNVVAVIVINFDPGSIAGSQSSCQDEDFLEFTSTAGATGDGTLTYQWQLSITGESEGFSNIQGATAATYDPGVVSVDTWYRRMTTASLGGTELNEYSNVISISVVSLTAGSIDNAQTFCSGEDAAALTSVIDATGEGTVVYQWQSSTTGATEGFSNLEGATASTYDPGVLTSTTWFRRSASTTVGEITCAKYSNAVEITVIQRRTISGTFYYYHSTGNIPLTGQNITVKLYRSSDLAHENLLGTTVTNGSGYYEFTGLCPDCDYDIVATSTGSTSGAINTTDAAHVNFWGAHNSTIEKVKFYCGDVGTSGQCQDLTINSTDAGRIQQRFVYGYPFDRPWTFWKAGTTISTNPACESFPWTSLPVGTDVTMNMYGLVTGDFNRSFNPVMTKAASSTLSLVYQGNREINFEQEFDLPVRIVESATIGAISLIFNFPSNLVSVTDVVMNGAGGMLDWAVDGDELRIGWNAANPMYLQSNAELLVLRLKTVDGFKSTDVVTISLAADPLNELADANFEVIGNAVLAVETINGNALGVTEPTDDSGLFFSNYPNPFGHSTKISYTLPADGHVMISISNFTGSRLITLADEYQTAGNYELILDSPGIPTGVYIATITVRTENEIMMKTHKIIKR